MKGLSVCRRRRDGNRQDCWALGGKRRINGGGVFGDGGTET